MKKINRKAVIFFLSFSLCSCFVFDNPVDPKSPGYVGYPVKKGVTMSEFSRDDYGELFYPSLTWTQIPGSIYYLQLSKNKDFSFSPDDYQGVFSYHQLMKNSSFDISQGWFTLYESQYLDRLGAGTYYIRVSVSNTETGNEFRTWSRPSVYTQKLKQIKAGWEDNSRFSVYSYTNDGLYKKEDSYFLFVQPNQETETRYLETVVYAYRPDGEVQFEFVYNDPKALPAQYNFHYFNDIRDNINDSKTGTVSVYRFFVRNTTVLTTSDRTALKSAEFRYFQNGKVKNIEYYSPIPGVQIQDDPNADNREIVDRYFYPGKERIYNYDKTGNVTSICENRYRYNQDDNTKREIISYYIFKVRNGSIYRGEYYASPDATAYTYVYDVFYHDTGSQYPAKAVYTYSDGSSGEDYIYDYNFTTVGQNGGSDSTGDIEIGFTKKTFFGSNRPDSVCPEVPLTGFVSEK